MNNTKCFPPQNFLDKNTKIIQVFEAHNIGIQHFSQFITVDYMKGHLVITIQSYSRLFNRHWTIQDAFHHKVSLPKIWKWAKYCNHTTSKYKTFFPMHNSQSHERLLAIHCSIYSILLTSIQQYKMHSAAAELQSKPYTLTYPTTKVQTTILHSWFNYTIH